jgi:hypothetical protein
LGLKRKLNCFITQTSSSWKFGRRIGTCIAMPSNLLWNSMSVESIKWLEGGAMVFSRVVRSST